MSGLERRFPAWEAKSFIEQVHDKDYIIGQQFLERTFNGLKHVSNYIKDNIEADKRTEKQKAVMEVAKEIELKAVISGVGRQLAQDDYSEILEDVLKTKKLKIEDLEQGSNEVYRYMQEHPGKGMPVASLVGDSNLKDTQKLTGKDKKTVVAATGNYERAKTRSLHIAIDDTKAQVTIDRDAGIITIEGKDYAHTITMPKTKDGQPYDSLDISSVNPANIAIGGTDKSIKNLTINYTEIKNKPPAAAPNAGRVGDLAINGNPGIGYGGAPRTPDGRDRSITRKV